MTHPPGSRAVRACTTLLNTSPSAPEDNIRQNIARLLDILDIENLITYTTDAGPADLYLPRRRVFIETKKVGGAENPAAPDASTGESPHRQLERYLKSEIASELAQFSFQDDEERTRSWIGIVTDGRVWHAWRYAHEEGSVGETIFTHLRPTNGEELLTRVEMLLAADPVGKPWIPANPSDLFTGHLDALRTVRTGLSGRAERIASTQMELWLDMLRTSSMAPANEPGRHELFLRHSFLVALARGVIHTLARPNQEPDAGAILQDGFVSWVLHSAAGRAWAATLLDSIHSHEWRRRRGDVLKPVYETFVGEADRKVFGEYYTPDWLAQMLVEEVLDAVWCERSATAALVAEAEAGVLEGIGVLDPACGSGTFLYHAARRLLRTPILQDAALPAGRKAGAIVRLLNGIDIHPIAAEISRATILRALPAEPPAGAASVRVFQGDALLAQRQETPSLFTHSDDLFRFATPGGGELSLPRSFARTRNFMSDMRRVTDSAVRNAGKEESDARFRPLAADILATVAGPDREALVAFHAALARVIDDEGNGVWSWYISNITGPVRIAERKVDRIVANPPWVKISEIQVPDRKTTMKELAMDREIDLWVGGKQGPHLDIAQLFVKRARMLYLKDPSTDPAAWVVKKAALKGGNWRKFRSWWWQKAGCQALDLEALRPFGGGDARRCCVLFDIRRCRGLTDLADNTIIVDHNPKAGRFTLKPDMQASHVLDRLRFRTPPKVLPEKASGYARLFRQGATIQPKVLSFIDREEEGSSAGLVRVVTARSKQLQWAAIEPARGEVPAGWVRSVHQSGDLLPFFTGSGQRAIIPVGCDGRRLIDDPGKQCDFWRRLDALYRENAAVGTSTPKTLLTQFNFAGKLEAQLPVSDDTGGCFVLYPKSGDIMRASRVEGCGPVVGDSLYWWKAESEEGAAYLVAFLNASGLTRAFGEARASGRDFHLHPWRKVPIPLFNARKKSHRILADLCFEAEQVVRDWLANADAPERRLGQVGKSKRIRRALRDSGVMRRIDDAVRRILPDHMTERDDET